MDIGEGTKSAQLGFLTAIVPAQVTTHWDEI
jgi:hypothetical protein